MNTHSATDSSTAADPFAAAGYGARDIGFGRRMAAVVVDFQLGFTDPDLPMGRSTHIHRARDRASEVLRELRALEVPVLHTVVAYDGPEDLRLWKPASLAQFTPGSREATLDPQVHGEGDVIAVKRAPSAFFGTDVAATLRFWDVDTVVVMGCVTSGCIRATTIDAFSLGFRTMVATDCCGDQDPEAHASNLRDVERRYADLVSGDEVVEAARRQQA